MEYIIVDGGSTDETHSVVKDYSSRLTFISEPDRGQSHAVNKGFRMARGELVAWLNSDDLFMPGAVSRASARLAAEPALGAVYGEGYLIARDGSITRPFPHTQPFDLRRLIFVSDYILQQTVFFRKTVFDRVGYLDEDLHYTMDWDILIRLGKRFPIGYIPEYMGCLREYPEAKSFAGGAPRIAEIRRLMIRHTGMRFAPGYIFYGLETYKQIWCDRIQQHTPPVLARPSSQLQHMIVIAFNLVIAAYHARWSETGISAKKPARRQPIKPQPQRQCQRIFPP